jgi:hypothetical protein
MQSLEAGRKADPALTDMSPNTVLINFYKVLACLHMRNAPFHARLPAKGRTGLASLPTRPACLTTPGGAPPAAARQLQVLTYVVFLSAGERRFQMAQGLGRPATCGAQGGQDHRVVHRGAVR